VQERASSALTVLTEHPDEGCGGIRESFDTKDHGNKGNGLLYHLRKAPIGSHCSFGKGYFYFVYLGRHGRTSVHSFVPPLV